MDDAYTITLLFVFVILLTSIVITKINIWVIRKQNDEFEAYPGDYVIRTLIYKIETLDILLRYSEIDERQKKKIQFAKSRLKGMLQEYTESLYDPEDK